MSEKEQLTLERALNFLINMQKCETMEQAFIKGYLFALGGERHLTRIIENISWETMKQDPSQIDAERDILNIAVKVARERINEANKLARKHDLNFTDIDEVTTEK